MQFAWYDKAMTPLVLTGAILAAPVLLLTVLRVNAMMVFLSLCLGVVLVQFVGEEAASTVGIIASDGSTNPSLVSLFLLFAPAVFTTVFMIRTVHGKFKQLLNFLISIAVGSLVLLLAEPLLAAELQSSITATPVWDYMQKLQTLVVSLGAIFSLLFLWLQRPSHGHEEGKKHRHK